MPNGFASPRHLTVVLPFLLLGAYLAAQSPGDPVASAEEASANGFQASRRDPPTVEDGADPEDARPTARANAARSLGGAPNLHDVQQAFSSIVDRLSPAVVSLRIMPAAPTTGPRATSRSREDAAIGTGLFIRADGLILTTHHVIEGAGDMEATLYDGRRYRASLVAADPRSDLAVLQTQVPAPAVADMATDAPLRRGHLVLALGHNLDLVDDGQIAVSLGVVSALGRPLPQALGDAADRDYGDMIQFSAPIRPGNSGGPLVDVRGRVVGIVTAAEGRLGGDGIGFAIPITAGTRNVIRRLANGETVDYGYLGVLVDDLTSDETRIANLSPGRGACIHAVLADGPGARAGLCEGDIIVAADAVAVESARQFVRLVGAAPPGTEISVLIDRNGRRLTAAVKTTRRPQGDFDLRSDSAASAVVANAPPRAALDGLAEQAQSAPGRRVTFRGALLAPFARPLHERANLPNQALLVTRVEANSPAGRAGLTPGDVIIRLEGQPLSSAVAAAEALAATEGDVLIGLASGGALLIKAE